MSDDPAALRRPASTLRLHPAVAAAAATTAAQVDAAPVPEENTPATDAATGAADTPSSPTSDNAPIGLQASRSSRRRRRHQERERRRQYAPYADEDSGGESGEEGALRSAIPDRAFLAAQLNPTTRANAAAAAAAATAAGVPPGPMVEAQQGQMGVVVDRVVETSALEDHAVVLHQLIHRTRHPDPVVDALFLVRAENRYIKWLFLLERLRAAGDEGMIPTGRIVPPLDVVVMWLAHLTAVRHFVEDVCRLFDDALLYLAPPMKRLRELLESPGPDGYYCPASARMWESVTGEPWALEFDDDSEFVIACPTCTAAVHVSPTDYLRLKLEPGFAEIMCAPPRTDPSESGHGGCGTLLTSSFLSAVRFVNDFKGSLREINTFVAGTLLNPVSGKPNHYLSKQIVQYLAQAPSVADLYHSVVVPVPSPPDSPVMAPAAAAAHGIPPLPSSMVSTVLSGHPSSTSSIAPEPTRSDLGSSSSVPPPGASVDGQPTLSLPSSPTASSVPAVPIDSGASVSASGASPRTVSSSAVGSQQPVSSESDDVHRQPSHFNQAVHSFWSTRFRNRAPTQQNLDPWRDISNVLFRLEVDLYALELEDHRLISWHIRAALERMERGYRNLVTPLSLDLVARVRGHWRTTATLVVAWLAYSGEGLLDPATLDDEQYQQQSSTTPLSAMTASSTPNLPLSSGGDSDEESGAETDPEPDEPYKPTVVAHNVSGSGAAEPAARPQELPHHVADGVMAMLPTGMMEVAESTRWLGRRSKNKQNRISVWVGADAGAHHPHAPPTSGHATMPALSSSATAAGSAGASGTVGDPSLAAGGSPDPARASIAASPRASLAQLPAPVMADLQSVASSVPRGASAYKLIRSKSVPASLAVSGSSSARSSMMFLGGSSATPTAAAGSSSAATTTAAGSPDILPAPHHHHHSHRARSRDPASSGLAPESDYIHPPSISIENGELPPAIPVATFVKRLNRDILAESTVRLHKFYLLQKSHAKLYSARLALPIDVVLCHWTHLLYPPRYVRFANTHFNRLITYEFATPQDLDAALKNTSRKWRRRYGERVEVGVRPRLSWSDKLKAFSSRIVGKLVSSSPV
ncbi:hypothetical protein BC828DRAFT_373745 [Blastocladiella britannica]|nr:hypothetical protein BC828DRAFT_373745 [Blastocladiella britannica]